MHSPVRPCTLSIGPTEKRHFVDFEPGMAVLHRGMIPHAALPIEKGERTNLVVWLFGKDGHIGYYPHQGEQPMSPRENVGKNPMFRRVQTFLKLRESNDYMQPNKQPNMHARVMMIYSFCKQNHLF